jgi:hypothetical protein
MSASSPARTAASSLTVHGFSFARTRRRCGRALGLVAGTLVAVTLVAVPFVAVFVAVFVGAFARAFAEALGAVLVTVSVATLLGTVFFVATPRLVAEVAFFTAMVRTLQRGASSSANADRWREDKAFALSTQW